jgi:two-component system sensor histidine kinase LytS
MKLSRSAAIDLVLAGITIALGTGAFLAAVVPDEPAWSVLAPLVGLAGVAAGMAVARWLARGDHVQAVQSQRVLTIADESLTHLRQGLTEQTAQAVCAIVLARTEAAAVAITDTTHILGFAGVGADHHQVGQPILTTATRQSLEHDELRVLHTREEISCPNRRCPLAAAVVVPLRMRDVPVGALKFYYRRPGALNETQSAMAEGLARLLSTQLELSELEHQTELACRMELKALQAQMNPHFLFNTINTIASLIRTDAPRARELLREFAAFYRHTLERGDDLITLDQELLYVRAYVRFAEARFGDRVRLCDEIDDHHRGLLVPAFILQPLVENAIQHGMRPEGALHIRLTSELDGDLAMLSVTDDGIGIPDQDVPRVLEPGFGKGHGIALRNVHDRLRGNFGPGSGVSVSSRHGTGTTVSLVIARPPHAATHGTEPSRRTDGGRS